MSHPNVNNTIAPQLRKIVTELARLWLERSDELVLLTCGLLSGQNIMLLGPPGTAKTTMAEDFCHRIVGARFDHVLLSKGLPIEALAGMIDLNLYRSQNIWQRRTEGTFIKSHIGVLDEVGKAGDATLNPLLGLLNPAERRFKNYGEVIDSDLLTVIGTTNEMLEGDESAAMADRWLFWKIVDYIQEPRNFKALLSLATSAPQNPTTVTLDDIMTARKVVETVTIPPGLVDSIHDLRADLYKDEIQPSDRTWRQSMSGVRASAYYSERDVAIEDDLEILRYSLWSHPEQIPTVEKKVLQRTSEETRKLSEWNDILGSLNTRLEASRKASQKERTDLGLEVQRKLKEVTAGVSTAIEAWRRKGRSTQKLEEVQGTVREVQQKMLQICMNVPVGQL